MLEAWAEASAPWKLAFALTVLRMAWAAARGRPCVKQMALVR